MTTAKNEVRKYVEDALNRFAIENGRALGWQDRVHYEYPSCVIVLQGENRFCEGWARYSGELGTWGCWLTSKGSRIKNPTPKLQNPAPVHRPA